MIWGALINARSTLSPRDGRPPVSRERLIHGIEIERGEIDDGERLVLAGSMFALANETGHRVPAQRLRVAAHAPEQPNRRAW